ncbi:MAG: hypothetical protein K1060chlam2_00662 [Chlamydiae bacterium]|nr:hypothetical protein [Chlamydiota bacterium]
MSLFLPTIIVRHRKENLKKCSLHGLETREDLHFYSYPTDPLPNSEGHLLLTMDGAPLSYEDRNNGLYLLDGTWKYAEVMHRQLKGRSIARSIPKEYRTSYPRKQPDCPNPERGLASVEALFIAYHILGHETAGLLDHYYWREEFLRVNAPLLECKTTCH